MNERLRKDPINPFVDWGFKYVFGREENKDLLIGFLNLLLEPNVATTKSTWNSTSRRWVCFAPEERNPVSRWRFCAGETALPLLFCSQLKS